MPDGIHLVDELVELRMKLLISCNLRPELVLHPGVGGLSLQHIPVPAGVGGT